VFSAPNIYDSKFKNVHLPELFVRKTKFHLLAIKAPVDDVKQYFVLSGRCSFVICLYKIPLPLLIVVSLTV